jgi:hypothetical protein
MADKTWKYYLNVDGTKIFWRSNRKPTQKQLDKWVLSYAKSLEKGGANEHVSNMLGYIPYPNDVKLIEASNVVVLRWKAPMFMVW